MPGVRGDLSLLETACICQESKPLSLLIVMGFLYFPRRDTISSQAALASWQFEQESLVSERSHRTRRALQSLQATLALDVD